jgi:hypothetical protein
MTHGTEEEINGPQGTIVHFCIGDRDEAKGVGTNLAPASEMAWDRPETDMARIIMACVKHIRLCRE